jgi:transcriptional accessory protein Tex/SPT6
VSELTEPPPSDPREVVQQGDDLVLRILRIDTFRHRISLSLKRVSAQQHAEWLTQRASSQIAETDGASDASFDDGNVSPAPLHTVEEANPSVSEQVAKEESISAWLPVSARSPEDEELWSGPLQEEEADQV